MLTVRERQPNDLLAEQLLVELFHEENPRTWRRRQVIQITPLDPESYLARISFQFRLSRELIQRAWENARIDPPHGPVPLPQGEIEVILPVNYLPKDVLLSFSLEDQSGKPLTLLTSADSSRLSLAIVEAIMSLLDEAEDDQVDAAAALFRNHKPIIFALISSGQREIPALLSLRPSFHPQDPCEPQFCSGMTAFYERVLKPFTGLPELEAGMRDEFRVTFRLIHQTITALPAELREFLAGPEGYHSPLLNPSLLVATYLKNDRPVLADQVHQRVLQFVAACYEFTQAVEQLERYPTRSRQAMGLLRRLSRYYVAYCRMKVLIGRDFIIKMEHVIPLEVKWLERFTGGWREQKYPFRIGDTASTHIEVTCKQPIELEQVPKATYLVFNDRRFPSHLLFGRSSHSTRYQQHFYTNMTPDEVRLALQAHGVQAGRHVMYDFRLRISYSVEATIMWGYRFVSLLTSVALIVFLGGYNPGGSDQGPLRLVPLVPLLIGLLGAVASLRTQERMVAVRTRKHKITVLVLVFLMSVYFLAGLIFPYEVTAFRNYVRGIPWLGWLMGRT